MADRILLGGAPEGYDATLLARELVRGQPVVHVARDDKRMEAMRAALAVVAPDAVVLDLPAWDCLPYDRVSPNPDVLARRMATLAVLAAGVPGPFLLLTTLNAATQRLPAREVIAGASFIARVETGWTRRICATFWRVWAFRRCPRSRNRGISPFAAALSISFRQGGVGRCGSISLAMCWTARDGLMRPRSAPRPS